MLRRLMLTAVAGILSLGIVAPHKLDAKTTRASLNRTLPEMKFDGVAFADAVDFIRDITDANIVVNWKALEAAGVNKDTVVNLKLRNVTLKKALALLLSEAAAGDGVTYTLEDGVIEITTTELANQVMFTRVYPVGDLLMEIPNFDNAPNFSLDQNQGSGGKGGSGSGGQSTIFGGNGGGGNNGNKDDKTPSKEERAEELLSLIRDTIYPDLWRENGGTCSIKMFRDNLVVTAPRMVQEAIGGTWE